MLPGFRCTCVGTISGRTRKAGAFTNKVGEQNTYRWDKGRRYRNCSLKSPKTSVYRLR